MRDRLGPVRGDVRGGNCGNDVLACLSFESILRTADDADAAAASAAGLRLLAVHFIFFFFFLFSSCFLFCSRFVCTRWGSFSEHALRGRNYGYRDSDQGRMEISFTKGPGTAVAWRDRVDFETYICKQRVVTPVLFFSFVFIWSLALPVLIGIFTSLLPVIIFRIVVTGFCKRLCI